MQFDLTGLDNIDILNGCRAYIGAMEDGKEGMLLAHKGNPFLPRPLILEAFANKNQKEVEPGSKKYNDYTAAALDCFDAVRSSALTLLDGDIAYLARFEIAYLKHRKKYSKSLSEREFDLFHRCVKYISCHNNQKKMAAYYFEKGLITKAQQKTVLTLISSSPMPTTPTELSYTLDRLASQLYDYSP